MRVGFNSSGPQPVKPAAGEALSSNPKQGGSSFEAVSPVSSADAVSAAQVVWDEVLPALTYGPHVISEILETESQKVPATPLQKALAAFGDLSTDEGRIAAWLCLLWSLRKGTSSGTATVDVEKLEAQFGTSAQNLWAAMRAAQRVVQPERLNYSRMANIVTALAKTSVARAELHPLVEALVRGDRLIPRSVAALEAVKPYISSDHLSGKGLVASQHLLPNTVPLLEALMEKGMAPENMYVQGSPYNNNPLVVVYLRFRGLYVDPADDNLGSMRFLKEAKLVHSEKFALHIARQRPPPNGWKILDDGGILQKVISGMEKATYSPERIVDFTKFFRPEVTEAVEQTTRGITEVPQPIYPVCAVCRAPGKILEGEKVGWALAYSLVFELQQRNRPLSQARVALVGAGTIGLPCASELRSAGIDGTLVDTKANVLAQAKEFGFKVAAHVEEVVPTNNVILSCTGRNIWNGGILANWDGLLVQGASMAAEFDETEINAFRGTPIEVGNKGRPLNFHGDGHAVLHHNEIGITLALLFLGVCADRPKDVKGGYFPLEEGPNSLQEKAIAAWKENLPPRRDVRTSGPPVLRPDVFSPSGARRDEWMAYLSSLRKPVSPPPNSVRGAAQVYFFEDEEGCVRSVDVSQGVSQRAPMTQVPKTVYPLSSEGISYFLATKEGEKFQAFRLDFQDGVAHYTPQGTFDQLVRTYVSDQRSATTLQGRLSLGIALREGHRLRVLKPDEKNFVEVNQPAQEDSLWLWAMRGALLQVQREPPRLIPMDPENSIFGKYWAMKSLPKDMVRIEGVATWPQQAMLALIGRDRDDCCIITVWDPANLMFDKCLVPLRLPKGSLFRGIRPHPDGLWGKMIIDYSLPGESSEIADFHSEVYDFLEKFLPR